MHPLVFIPGLLCDARLFTPQVAALSERTDVWVADTTRACTMYGLAKSILDSCPFEVFGLAGLSMGGIVAMEMLRQAEDRISGVALLDTNHLEDPPARVEQRIMNVRRAWSGELPSILEHKMIPNYFHSRDSAPRVMRELALDMGMTLGVEVFERQTLALRDRPDSAGTLAAYDRPALVLCGARDALCPVSRHEEMAGLLLHSTLVIVEGAGHLSTLEQPDHVSHALLNWMSEI